MKAKGYELKKTILMNGHSIKDFSVLVGISNTYLSSVINGRSSVSPKKAKIMANILNKEIKDLFVVDIKESV